MTTVDQRGEAEPLRGHSRLRGVDADALAAFLAAKNIALDLRRGAAETPLRPVINAAYLEGMYFGYMRYGPPVRLLAPPPRPDYGLSIPFVGGFEVRLDGRTFACGGDSAVVTSPAAAQSVALGEGCGRIGVSFARDAVLRQLTALLGRPAAGELIFDPAVDLASRPGRSLRRTLLFVLHELEQVEPAGSSRLWQRELEQLALTALLFSLRHSESERLHGPAAAPAPADVRRAIDYLQAHLDESLSLADLAAAAGVPGRTLLRHFRQFTGESPLGYARGARLARARDDLLRGDGSVTEIAARWGFGNFGRFAASYRRRFGELPSEMRRRAR